MPSPLPSRGDLGARRRRMLFAAVLVLGAGLRLYNLGEPSLWYDEAALFETSHCFDLRCTFMDVTQNMDPPLMLAAARFWEYPARAAGLEPTSMLYDYYLRLFPCLLGILSIWLVARVCRTWTGDATLAVLAAFFYAISPFQVYYAQEFRSYAVTVPLALAALLALHGALTTGRLRSWVALVALEALLVYNHFFSLSLIFSMNVFFLIYFAIETRLRDRALILKWTASQAAVVVLVLPALYMMRRADQMFINLKYPFYPPPEWKTGLITFKNFFAGYSPNVLAYQALFVVAAALVLIGAVAFARRRQWRPLFLFGVLLCLPIVASIIVWSNRDFPMYAHRLYVVSGVMAAIFAANGLRSLPSVKTAIATAAAVMVLTSICLADHYAQRLHPFTMHRLAVWDKVQNREAAAYIKKHRKPGDGIGHVTHFTQLPFAHYIDGMRQFSVAVTRFDIDEFVASQGNEPLLRNIGLLPSLMVDEEKNLKRLWFVESYGVTFNFPQRGDPIRAWLDERYTVLERTRFDGIVLTLYDLDLAKRERVFAERLEDDGTAPLPVYRVQNEVLANGCYGANTSTGWEMRLDKKQAGQFDAVITSRTPREIDFKISDAAVLMPPFAFRFADYNSGVWRQLAKPAQEDLTLPYTNDFSMLAYMSKDSPQAAIYRDFQSGPGTYDVYAMVMCDKDPANKWRGDEVFYIGDTEIGTVRGNDPSLAAPGWQWRRVGQFQSDGSPSRLTISARNPGLQQARIDMGYVAFVPAGTRPEARATRLTVDANTPKAIPLDIPPVGRRILLVEATDPAQRDVRSLLFVTTPQVWAGK